MFVVGKEYNRQKDIHKKYGGQRYGGISTPKKYPMIFIFTGSVGSKYGYEDKFDQNGIFLYTGEGKNGDMSMKGGNRAIRDHQQEGKELHIFESIKKGFVRYMGKAIYVDHHIEQRPDASGNKRNAYIFHLALLPYVDDFQSSIKKKRAVEDPFLEQLRQLALNKLNLNTKTIIENVGLRSQAVRRYALRRAQGICEGCQKEAPFNSKDGPYLEVHHLYRLSDGGPDHPENVIALCPNCHRRVHYGVDGKDYNEYLISIIKYKYI